MNKIYTLDDEFNFEDIELEHPSSLQGGSYFTRMNIHSSPVYIQTSPCSTKSGIVNTAKKSYCDLMFNSHDDKPIQWFEELERHCINAIFQKKDIWFHNEMELDDIEAAFTSPVRLYKSGKNYLIRSNIANNSLSTGTFKCYDEHSNPVSLDKLDNTTIKIIPLLEVQGIRFTSKNFTLELALKQIMIIENPDFMNECFIQPRNIKSIRQNKSEINLEASNKYQNTEQFNNQLENIDNSQNIKDPQKESEILQKETLNNSEEAREEAREEATHEATEETRPESTEETRQESTEEITQKAAGEATKEIMQEATEETTGEVRQEATKEATEAIEEAIQEGSSKPLGNSSPTILDEVILDYNNLGNEAIKLKTHEEVYYDLWYEARSRAKLAREEAIKAYLEAKNIKNTYMLDNFSDSEDEFQEYLEE